jgi:hypothetical protein
MPNSDDVLSAAHAWAAAREGYHGSPGDPRAGEAFRLAEEALAEAVRKHGITESQRLDPDIIRWLDEGGHGAA